MIHVVTMQRLGAESSPEVSSSSPLGVSAAMRLTTSPNPTGSSSSDIGEVDLDFWDLDLNARGRMVAGLHHANTNGHGNGEFHL
jgi:hypothetical protein